MKTQSGSSNRESSDWSGGPDLDWLDDLATFDNYAQADGLLDAMGMAGSAGIREAVRSFKRIGLPETASVVSRVWRLLPPETEWEPEADMHSDVIGRMPLVEEQRDRVFRTAEELETEYYASVKDLSRLIDQAWAAADDELAPIFGAEDCSGDFQALIDKFRCEVAQVQRFSKEFDAATDARAISAAVRKGNRAGATLRQMAACIGRCGPDAIRAFSGLMNEDAPDVEGRVAFLVLEVMDSPEDVVDQAFAVIERRANGTGVDALGTRMRLRELYAEFGRQPGGR